MYNIESIPSVILNKSYALSDYYVTKKTLSREQIRELWV
jgi:hypothetical protein